MDSNETILKNVHLAFERFVGDQAKRGIKATQSSVARKMAELSEKPMGDPVRTLRLLMNGDQIWKPKLLELFAAATDTRLQDLYSQAYQGHSMPDDDYPSYFRQWIRRELTVDQMRAVVTMLRRDLKRPGAFELACAIHSAIVEADDLRSARDMVDDILRASKLWDKKPEPSRKKIPN